MSPLGCRHVKCREPRAELRDLTGDELLPILRACQRRCDAMVSTRLAEEKNTTIGDLREFKSRIQLYIIFCVTAVIGTLNAAEPNIVESVEAALLPIVNIRLGRSPSGGRPAAEDEGS